MSLKVVANPNRLKYSEAAGQKLKNYSTQEAEKAFNFHSSIDVYAPTPMLELPRMSTHLGVKKIFVKDESYRFGLNAFKSLGGSYAIGKYIAKKLGLDISQLPYEKMISNEVRAKLGEMTFISATDGNHGRGVAWTANKLKQKCVIHMPKGSSQERLDNIIKLGAKADITDLNYDDAVRLSDKEAKEFGWTLVQDTSWPGYEEIPISIVQGYTTMLHEAIGQLTAMGGKPTHIFAQAGVGSFSTAMVSYFVNKYGDSASGGPKYIIVEPNAAACIFDTLVATDGKIHPVTGDMKTIMAGLACGEPVSIGIDILRNFVDFVVSMPDYFSASGMRALGAPDFKTFTGEFIPKDRPQDPRIISGESGAATFGFAYEILSNPKYKNVVEMLGINQDSTLFFISTEGDTDRHSYRNIVWNGAYPRP
jgi:diaminopropionate ammonia-lyase